MAEKSTPRVLVIDGYTQEAREVLKAGGASIAADLYRGMLQACAPFEIECEYCFPSDPDSEIPADSELDRFDGIAWTGCSLSLAEESPVVARQVQLAHEAFERGIPSFGSCWAAQIAVVAAGGTVEVNTKGREMGIARKIELTEEGREHPLYQGKPLVFDGFTSHDDHITSMPSGAISLSGNEWTPIQAVSVTHGAGEFWAVQYHPEYDLHEMARLMHCRIEKLIGIGFFPDKDTALKTIEEYETLHQDPGRSDLAQRLGVDADVADSDLRTVEVRNWINEFLAPVAGNKE
jgi:GMP synthase (glutamine-hydrolysing)